MGFKRMERKCIAFRCENGGVYDYSLGFARFERVCSNCNGTGVETFLTVDPGKPQTVKTLPVKTSTKRDISAGDMLAVVFIIGFFALVITGG